MSQPLVPPIFAASTYRFPDSAALERATRREEGTLYSRWENPTVRAAEDELARLCGAERALAFGSGMAAISAALLTALAERPLLLCQEPVYGGTDQLVRQLLPRWGVEVRRFPCQGWEAALDEAGEVGVVYAECPTNPTLRLVDLPALAAAAHARGALLLVDNTFATPLNQRTLELGADVELHSATKYLGGHHDLLAGVVAGSAAFCERLWLHRTLLGGILDPFPAYLLHRGLRTLEVRLERQNATALALAQWLERHPGVERVHYPFLASHPDQALARRQLRGGGGMVSFEVAGGAEAATRLADALETIALAASLGGVESSACLPANTSHHSLSPAERERLGLSPGLVRFSVGLEPCERLQAELERALRAAAG